MIRLDQLSSRERSMVIGLGSVFALLIVILVPLQVSSWLSGKARANDELRAAIGEVDAARGRIAARRAALGDVAARYANRAPPLGVLVDDAAKGAKLEIGVQTDVPPIPRGKLYTERATKLQIQRTGLRPLTEFLERIETSGHPIAVTAFDMTKRIEADSYSVNMTISAYDRADAPPSGGAR